METVNSIIATHKRTWAGTLVGGVAGYYTAKKAIKTNKWWAVGLSVVAGMVAGSIVQDKISKPKLVVK